MFDKIAKLVQILSIVAGVVISVVTIAITIQKDATAREAEAKVRTFEAQKYADQRRDQAAKERIEAAKPFLQLRQQRYLEALQAAAVLASPGDHELTEVKRARKRFWELYWAELSMVEARSVEGAMKSLGDALEPDRRATPVQIAAYNLAHALRDSLLESWGISSSPN